MKQYLKEAYSKIKTMFIHDFFSFIFIKQKKNIIAIYVFSFLTKHKKHHW